MWVRMTRRVIAGRAPREIGNVLDLPEMEARLLILEQSAVECDAPPSVPQEAGAAGHVETVEAPQAGVEQAVTRKRK